ncbi:MAG: 3-phosphoserine/phosphohydroxythreonine transaminase [Spirochaetales bacterium]|nr:3-phosphoserine/phosphohydroxythreonine transaminase [Spirochaetales bacterium]
MRVYNFSAGPAVLPEEVLQEAQNDLIDYKGHGMSIMEMSHRSKPFMALMEEIEQDLREIMAIPANYKVLFLQGGASLQFAMVPLNLFSNSKKSDFLITGAWSKKAMAQAKVYGSVKVIGSSEDKIFSYIPQWKESDFTPDADFFHITSNNTIYGTRFTDLPNTGKVPLVADMSSNILSEPVDVSRYALIYAGAQKNIGPAGLTIVIIREDLIGKAMDITPIMLNYQTHSEADSAYNTPPCYSLYISGLVFKWVKKMGGLEAMLKYNEEKAAVLYDFLDQSALFSSPVSVKDRSLMNVPFVTGNPDIDAQFIKEAEKQGLVTLKGHRSVGGMRASIYNAMPLDGVKKLVEVMKKFEAQNK